ncbi:hypothetical protein [Pedobacter sp. JY14-1]|uniref:hypothetical protein n=1 Tax=Pedobacter sp. JY14-1 TaxID=3034151 RepID=UPI0023E10617|nr:hypothetical protein [Pedobacter sp. JY14-1]
MLARRDFIKTLTTASITYGLGSDPFVRGLADYFGIDLPAALVFDHAFDVQRPQDHVFLRFYLVNMRPYKRQLVRIQAGEKKFMVVRLPQMHVAQQIFDYSDSPQTAPPLNEFARSFVGEFSPLTFRVPDDYDPEYSAEGLLDWSRLQLCSFTDLLNPDAMPISFSRRSHDQQLSFDPALNVNRPERFVPLTYFEAPYKMKLAPIPGSLRPLPDATYQFKMTGDNRTRTIFSSGGGKDAFGLFRIWENDLQLQESSISKGIHHYPPNFKVIAYDESTDKDESGKEVVLQPNADDRKKIARLTNLKESDRDVLSSRFRISGFGATMDLKYKNDNHRNTFLTGWTQDTVYGQDNYSTITIRGIDVRTGLKLELIRISERRVEAGMSFMLRRYYFSYIEREKIFADPVLFNNIWCKSIRALDTGAYYKPQPLTPDGSAKGFIPYTETLDRMIRMPYVATDQQGNEIVFTEGIDLMIIREEDFKQDLVLNALKVYDQEYLSKPVRHLEHLIRLGSVKICFAPPRMMENGNFSENTVLETQDCQFYSMYGGEYNSANPIIPQLKFASVYIPQLEGVESVPKARKVAYAASYFKHGFGDLNPARIFLQTLSDQVVNTPVDGYLAKVAAQDFRESVLKSSAAVSNVFTENYKNIGGMINPDIRIDNLADVEHALLMTEAENQKNGAVAEIQSARPEDLLRGLNVEIFGAINLLRLFKEVVPLDDMPAMKLVNDAEAALKTIDQYRAEYMAVVNQVNQLVSGIALMQEQLKSLASGYREIEGMVTKYLELLKSGVRLQVTMDSGAGLGKFQISVGNAVVLSHPPFPKPLTDFLGDFQTGVAHMMAASQIPAAFARLITVGATDKLIEFQYTIKINLESYLDREFKLVLARLPALGDLKEAEKLVVGEYFNQALSQLRTLKEFRLPDELLKGISDLDSTASGIRFLVKKDGFWVYLVEDDMAGWEELLHQYQDRLAAQYPVFFEMCQKAMAEVLPYSKQYVMRAKTAADEGVERIQSLIANNVQKELDALQPYIKLEQSFQHHVQLYQEYFRMYRKALRFQELKYINIPDGALQALGTALSKGQADLKRDLLSDLEAIKSDLKQTGADAAVSALDRLITKLRGLDSLVSEGVDAAFAELQELILKKKAVLFQFLDAKAQQLRNRLNEQEKLLSEKRLMVQNFFKTKLREIEDKFQQAKDRLAIAVGLSEAEYNAAKSNYELAKEALDKIRAATKREIRYNWKTEALEERNFGLVSFSKNETRAPRLELDVTARMEYEFAYPPRLSKTELLTSSKLTDFTLTFFNILSVSFDEVSFTAGTGRKEKFDVRISNVGFNGALDFVEVFQEYLQTLDKGLSLEFDASGVSLSYGISIPDITGGTFNFAFARLMMGVKLPFVPGTPMSFIFGFNSPGDMFLVSAGIFGGRGCFQIGIDPKRGIVFILLVLEFGGVLLLNIGVARGMVYLFAGLYFRKDNDKIELRGYLVCGGELNILRLVSASVVFNMGLRGDGNYAEGFCTVYYKIRISFLITIKVGLNLYKRIYGSQKDGGNRNKIGFDGAAPLLKGEENTVDPTEFDMSEKDWQKFFKTIKHI